MRRTRSRRVLPIRNSACGPRLLEESDREGILPDLAIICLDRGDDREDDPDHKESEEQRNADQNKRQQPEDHCIDKLAKNPVRRVLAVLIDARQVVLLDLPDSDWQDKAEDRRSPSSQGRQGGEASPTSGWRLPDRQPENPLRWKPTQVNSIPDLLRRCTLRPTMRPFDEALQDAPAPHR